MSERISPETREWNPRYLAYVRATGGGTPEATLVRDREKYPGGAMCGFILWMSARWREWDKLVHWPAGVVHGQEAHHAFDAWLNERWPLAEQTSEESVP